MKKNRIRIVLLVYFLFLDTITFAQPMDEDDGGDLEGNDPAPAPINNKLFLLFLLGVLLIFYKLRKFRKEMEMKGSEK